MVRHSPGFGGWFESFTYSLGSGIVATLSLNITERKQTEEALRLSQENFVKAFNSNPAAIAITRLADGKFLNLNPAYTRIMEYEPHELLDHTAAEMNIYVHPEERDSLIQQLREHGTIQNYELVVRIKSGETRNIVISMEPILYNEQECILSVFIDISERKKMEQELQRSNAELAQFAYIASHDLQEPLRAVAGMVQLLGQRYQGKLDARADEYIELAVDASTRMQKLINDLLSYSRVDRNGKSFESINAEALLNIALANLQVAIQESNATVTHDALPTIFSDSSQLTQVFQNLIGNAIKFRGERPLQIHIGVHETDNTWRFEVRDNGIGIEPQYYERIFLVFQRLHTRREYPGTGIGLSLCKKIVERHGGRIWVESEPGQGSTFYFTIPQRQ
jgi:PAS domain S-box-containing protein